MMRSHLTRADWGFVLFVLALGAPLALAAASRSSGIQSMRHPGASPPPWASAVEEHAARAEQQRLRLSTAQRDSSPREAGLVTWKQIGFPALLYPENGLKPIGAGFVAGMSSDGVLATLDAQRGVVVGAFASHQNARSFDAGVGPNGPRALFAGPNWRGEAQGFTVVNLNDPANPVVIATGEPCAERGVVLPGTAYGFVWGDKCSFLISTDDGRRITDFSRPVNGAYGAMLDGAPLLLVRRPGTFYNQPGVLEAWWLAPPEAPPSLWYFPIGQWDTVWVDPRNRFVAVGDRTFFDIHDLRTGALLSTITPSSPVSAAAFVISDNGGALALASEEFVEIFDLGDPTRPRSIGKIAVHSPFPYADSYALLPHPDQPWLLIETLDPLGFLVIDTRDASVVASYSVSNLGPWRAAWTQLADGTPAVAWTGVWYETNGPHTDGGLIAIDTVALDPSAGTRRVARYAPVAPRDIDAVVPVAGRYAAVVDVASNAIVLADTSTGKTADAFGFSQPVYGYCWWNWPIVASAGSTFVVGDGCAAEIVDVSRGKLIRRGGIPPPGSSVFSDLAVTPDGTVLSLWPDDGLLLASRPDGTIESLSLGTSSLQSMALSESGSRVVLTAGYAWAEPDSPMIVALTDSPGLRVSWSNTSGALFAAFVRNGTAIAATVQQGYHYGPRLFDAVTGAPLGSTGDMAIDYFYVGPGVPFGTGAGERMLYWNWTFCAWASTVFDIHGDSPRLIGTSDQYLWDPQQLRRDDDRTAFEVRDEGTFVVSGDGMFTRTDGERGNGLRKLRRGFWTGFADAPYREHRTVMLLRDLEVNRAPVADPGPDRTLECAAPAGTPVHLDGRESSDPDSSPGTQDDISAYAWAVNGALAGASPEADVRLPVGSSMAHLEVTDVLGLTSAKDSLLRVVDTTPPTVSLAMGPYLPPSRVWSHQWTLTSVAQDICDGALPAPALLPLAHDVLSAPVEWTSSTAPAVEVIRGSAGLSIRLLGPQERELRAQWSAAIAAGGLVPSSDPITLITSNDAPRTSPRGLVARYDLTDRGALSAAAAYGAGADIPFTASARDAAGNVASAGTTLGQTTAQLCASTPDNVACRSKNAGSRGRTGPSPAAARGRQAASPTLTR